MRHRGRVGKAQIEQEPCDSRALGLERRLRAQRCHHLLTFTLLPRPMLLPLPLPLPLSFPLPLPLPLLLPLPLPLPLPGALVVVVASVVGRIKGGVEESVTVTLVAEEMVEVLPLITVMVNMYSLIIVLPAEHVVATALEDGGLMVTVEPIGHVDLEADAVTVTVEARFGADWVSVTVWPVAAGQVEEPATVTVVVRALAVEAAGHVDEQAIVTVEVPPGRVTPGAVTVIVGPAIAEPETVAVAVLMTVTVLDTVVVTAEPVRVTVEAVAVTVFVTKSDTKSVIVDADKVTVEADCVTVTAGTVKVAVEAV